MLCIHDENSSSCIKMRNDEIVNEIRKCILNEVTQAHPEGQIWHFLFFYKWILALNVYAYLSQSTYGNQETRKQPFGGG